MYPGNSEMVYIPFVSGKLLPASGHRDASRVQTGTSCCIEEGGRERGRILSLDTTSCSQWGREHH